MKRISTILRICFGLATLVGGVVLAAEVLGLISNPEKHVLKVRQSVMESLASRCCLAIKEKDFLQIQAVLSEVVLREKDILSAGLRLSSGELVADSGPHGELWKTDSDQQVLASQGKVPIFLGENEFANLEVCFTDLNNGGGVLKQGNGRLLVFVLAGSFLAFYPFLKSTLKHLDPSKVIPERVKTALDSFAEGVFMVDTRGQIVLANSVFSRTIGMDNRELLGKKASEFNWSINSAESKIDQLPWLRTLKTAETLTDVHLLLNNNARQIRSFKTNVSPIIGDGKKCRGALVTLNDNTVLQKRNMRMKQIIKLLRNSRFEIKKQNRRLELLAKCDPLTGCLNRRAFFEKMDVEWETTRRTAMPLGCVMIDIDHFKSINDNYGHACGDMVLKKVAQVLNDCARKNEVVCRYGGEEFCIYLINTTDQKAVNAAERFRKKILSEDYEGIKVTASFGVSSTTLFPENQQELLNQADKALYHAKETGRNRVCNFKQLELIN